MAKRLRSVGNVTRLTLLASSLQIAVGVQSSGKLLVSSRERSLAHVGLCLAAPPARLHLGLLRLIHLRVTRPLDADVIAVAFSLSLGNPRTVAPSFDSMVLVASEARKSLTLAFHAQLRAVLGGPRGVDVARPLERTRALARSQVKQIESALPSLSRSNPDDPPDWPAIKAIWRWQRCVSFIQRIGMPYDRIIFTRSDYLWLAAHPPLSLLDPAYLWVPDGQDYQSGLHDSHAVASADIAEVYAARWASIKNESFTILNAPGERLLRLHLVQHGIKIARFLPVAVIACCSSFFQEYAITNGERASEASDSQDRCPDALARCLDSLPAEQARSLLSKRNIVGPALAEYIGAKYDMEFRTAAAVATQLSEHGWRWKALKQRDSDGVRGTARLHPPCFSRSTLEPSIMRSVCCDELRFGPAGWDKCFFAFNSMGHMHPAYSFDRCCAREQPLLSILPPTRKHQTAAGDCEERWWCWELLLQGGPGEDIIMCLLSKNVVANCSSVFPSEGSFATLLEVNRLSGRDYAMRIHGGRNWLS